MPTERLRVVPVAKSGQPKQTDSPMGAEPSETTSETELQPEPTTETSSAGVLIAQTLGVIAAIAGLTAVRLLILLSASGAFYLAVIAEQRESTMGIAVFVAFCVLIVLPLVWLDSTKRGPG
jgi:hypothetical protein